ncbi:MAG: gliding motility-associated C-terminal domain-containing protein [Bacteroidia bacterium]|nr:gliding motility-associated C-terminal domain-containing protein [Bacteroidia bacterium]
MKNIKPIFYCFIIISFILLFFKGFSSDTTTDWNKKWDLQKKAFIENKGQFDGRNWQKTLKVEYAIDYNGLYVFFNRSGLTYRFDKIIRNPNRKSDEDIERDKKEEPKRINISELVNVTWLESNDNVELTAHDKADFYFSYAIRKHGTKEVYNINHINGFNKLTYKNLYSNVDVDYEIDSEKGIKYTLFIHPGADISNVRMKYKNNHTNVKSEFINYSLGTSGNFNIKTSLGEITELKPYAYYKDNHQEAKINFRFENDILSFEVENYDNTRELVIDPWIVSATFNSSTAVWEVETDGSGNVYVIGGETPMKLNKYTSAGAFVWSYSTPWDTATVWLGTLATDNSGTNYITSGTAPEMERVDNGANMIWHSNGNSLSDEWWSITFNCDKTRLIVGGTILNMLAFQAYATIFNMDLTNGDVLSSQNFAFTSLMGLGAYPVEVRSISSSKSAKYIFLTHNDVGAINQNLGLCPNNLPVFQIDNNHHLGYKCENYLPATQNGGGLKALVANDQYIYTHSGNTIYKRFLSNGALITSVPLPGGVNQTVLGKIVVHCSGLAVDNCGNVYAGSTNQVVKFDANLNILSQTPVNFTVYDVSVNTNGEVIAVGAQADNGSASRNGKIQAINMSACAQFALTCCDANICHSDTVCTTDPAFTLISSSPGGTWSGTGITNASTGLFDPAAAGAGSHTVYYTLACGTDSTVIVVNACANLSVCQQTNGNLTVSNGTEPYTWEQYNPASTTPITNSATCTACGGTWFFGTCLINSMPATDCNTPAYWSVFAYGTTVTPPGTYPIRVTDNYSNTLTITSLASLPYCTNCPTLTITPVNIVNATCNGQSTGSFSVTTTGGTSPYDYTLMNGSTTVATFNNVSGSQNFTGLPAGNYTLNVVDNDTCPGSIPVNITQPTVLTVTITGPTSLCSGGSATLDAGTGFSSYLWSTNATTQTITVTTGVNYSVTVTNANGCTANNSVTVINSVSPTASVTVTNASCGSSNGSATVTAGSGTPPYSYLWSGGQATSSINNQPAGAYTVTVTDNAGCTVTDVGNISSVGGPTVTVTVTDAQCNSNNGTATVSASGGNPPYVYLWSTGSANQTITGLSGGSYTVSVTDANSCVSTGTATITQPPSVAVQISNPVMISCFGASNGSATANGSAGTPPYSYLWSNGQAAATATTLPAGTNTVTITDSNGCMNTASINITQPSALNATIAGTNNLCNGDNTGSANLTVSGGTPSYSYFWSNGQTTEDINNLQAGSYIVTVTDNNSCTITSNVVLTQPSAMNSQISNQTNVSCNGGTDGNATVTTIGGTQPYTYSWSTTPVQTTATASSLTAGTYTVTVTDANNCTSTTNAIITEHSVLSSSITSTDASCFNGNSGSAQLTVIGGALPYTFNWSNGANTQDVTGLNAGTYTVQIFDANLCNITDTVTITQPTAIIITTGTITNPSCYGGSNGSAIISASGGIPPYTYSWSSNPSWNQPSISTLSTGVSTVTVTDANGCYAAQNITLTEPQRLSVTPSADPTICLGSSATLSVTAMGGTPPYFYHWNNNETTSSITVSPATTTLYNCYVTDANNCMSGVQIITVNIFPHVSLQAMVFENSICPDDSTGIYITATNGVSPYMFYLLNGTFITPTPLYYVSPQQTQQFTIIVKDQCNSTDTASVTINVYPLPGLNITADKFEGCIPLTVYFHETSLNAGQSYTWNFDDLDENNLSHSKNPVHVFTTPGAYDISLTVTSADGCIIDTTYTNFILVYPVPDARFIYSPAIPNILKPVVYFTNLSSGNIGNYWLFGDGESSLATNPEHVYKDVGSYTVTLIAITDKGCKDTLTQQVNVEDYLTIYAPSAFSPDQDGKNDVFLVFGSGIMENSFSLMIFDRWGEKIFESDDINKGWDGKIKGKKVQVGTYVWIAVFKDFAGNEKTATGKVSVIR